jgi:hypothetical protein
MKLLKVYSHGWYVHITFHELPERDFHACQKVIWVATECSRHDLSICRGCLVQSPRHIPVIVGRGASLLPSHIVYIHLRNKEVLQHIEVAVTRNGTLGEKVWSAHLCSAYSKENIHLRTVTHMFNSLVWIL